MKHLAALLLPSSNAWKPFTRQQPVRIQAEETAGYELVRRSTKYPWYHEDHNKGEITLHLGSHEAKKLKRHDAETLVTRLRCRWLSPLVPS